jgi:hypothetical protein
MTSGSHFDVDDLMVQRVYGEFLEMPGLRLTSRQAQRLWGLDEQTCRKLLDFLVDAKFLCLDRGAYSRTTDGFTERPPLRMARGRAAGSRPKDVKAAG